jgi:predicted ATP-grasp superfamily ATP-dependent carboligase
MIEFKRDEKDGLYKYIEINPRLGMCNFFDTSCNVNNVFLTYLLSKQEKIQNIANLKMRSNVVFLSLFEDYFSRIKDGEGSLLILRNYLSNFNKKHVFIYFVWWDPKPALIIGWKQFKSIVMSFNKKLISYFKGK